MTERSAHASQAAVVLDIGGDVGALVLYTGAEDDEAEIDISPGTDPAAPRSHNQVHPRRAPAGVVYSAVYPALAAGEYTLWRDEHTPEATITIRGGQITEHRLSAPLGPRHHAHPHDGHTHPHDGHSYPHDGHSYPHDGHSYHHPDMVGPTPGG